MEARKPTEKAPEVTPEFQPNSAITSGNSRPKPVRAVTATPMVTKATPTTIQP